jgi:sulfhydrogenase subunit delta
MQKKLVVGWFSFSCCEDSTILFTELLNDRWEQWIKLIEFRHARVLKSNNQLKDLDVAFVEGAIANKRDREELIKIRANSKKVVAIGSCACTGIPSNQRNFFDEDTKKSIQYLTDKYGYEAEVVPISKVVKIDDEVPGCPMVEATFLKIIDKYLKEFQIIPNA